MLKNGGIIKIIPKANDVIEAKTSPLTIVLEYYLAKLIKTRKC